MASKNQNKAPSSSSSVIKSFQKLEVNDLGLQSRQARVDELRKNLEDELRKNLEALQEKFAKEEAHKLEIIKELDRTNYELAMAKMEIQNMQTGENQTIENNKYLHKCVTELQKMSNEADEKLKYAEACVEAELSALKKYLCNRTKADKSEIGI